MLRDENKISEELREKYLSISLEKAEYLEDLINEFFEITRFNLSNITLEYSRVNLTRMLEQLTYEFKPMFLEKNLKCELEIAPDTMIKCDVNKMQRVFDNLLRNAGLSNFKSRILENTDIFSVFGASALPFSLIFSLTGENKGKFFYTAPTTLSSSLAEVRLASLVAWA